MSARTPYRAAESSRRGKPLWSTRAVLQLAEGNSETTGGQIVRAEVLVDGSARVKFAAALVYFCVTRDRWLSPHR